ncbi:MAG: histidinol dehydrogenase [Muribaculaceae bacterium]|nr:histidinol dehydrogenase [Muribaculaceae bacterium]
MKEYRYPSRNEWGGIMQRAINEGESVADIVRAIIDNVKAHGDSALKEYALKFDGATLDCLRVSQNEINEAERAVGTELKTAIRHAAENIRLFHAAQIMDPITVEVMPGITCSQREVPISNVGLYIPGGNSPLFSTVLMLAVPAKIAGCRHISLCTPCGKDGKVHPAILFAAEEAGVNEIYKIGGAQAIAAMAVGTESVPKVDKIFGPGNRFVMEAKQQVSSTGVAIDMPAGPSEVMIIADAQANLDFIATDFLSQAEHGPDSQSILLTTDSLLATALPTVIMRHLDTLPRREMMLKSLSHSSVVLLKDDSEIWDFANAYAPEHLIINREDALEQAENVINAGSVFLGAFSPESAGDYASGTNHTLPTSGYATAFSGVNLDSFMKKITFQHLTQQGLESLAGTIECMAENEHLMAHRLAVSVRINKK